MLNPFNYTKYIKLFIEILAVVGIAAIIFFAVNFIKGGTYINTNSQAVVLKLQELNRYETVEFTIEKIIDAGSTGNIFSQILFGDKLLLIANGKVIAGFDFSKLKSDSVQINGTSVTLNLPPPEILFTTLNEEQTRVYDRTTGILTKGDKDLESKAREAAQNSIQKAACEENILDEAAKNGRSQLTALLKALGFTTVIINIPHASC